MFLDFDLVLEPFKVLVHGDRLHCFLEQLPVLLARILDGDPRGSTWLVLLSRQGTLCSLGYFEGLHCQSVLSLGEVLKFKTFHRCGLLGNSSDFRLGFHRYRPISTASRMTVIHRVTEKTLLLVKQFGSFSRTDGHLDSAVI